MILKDLIQFKDGYIYVHNKITWTLDVIAIIGLILDVSGVFQNRLWIICLALLISRFFWGIVQQQNKGGLVNWILRY